MYSRARYFASSVEATIFSPAERISAVAIFPCEGMRDAKSEAALAAAFAKGRAQEVTRLYRRDDLPEENLWRRGRGWCLAYR